MKRTLIVVCIAAGALMLSAAVALAGGDPHHAVEIHVTGTNPGTPPDNQILITGGIAASGTTTNVSEGVGMVTTPEGTFKVNTRDLNNAMGAGAFNRDTCSGEFTESAPVELFDGTGAYAGIHGTVKLTVTYAAITARRTNGTCADSQSETPTSELSIFQGSGKVELGSRS